MADFPVVVASESSQEDTSTTTHTVELPAGIEENELLLVFFATDLVAVSTFPSGWYAMFDIFAAGPNARLKTLIRYADGTEGSSIQIDTAANVKSEHVVYRIGCYERHAAPQWTFATQNAGADFSSPLLDPAAWESEDIMWISAIVIDLGSGISAFPSGYTDNQHNVFTTGGDESCLAVCTRELNASSEDPPSFTHQSANAVAATIGIRPIRVTPAPSFVNKGSFGGHTFNSNDGFTIPEGTIPDDLMLLAVETGEGTLTTPSGWNELPDSPQASGGTQLTIYWRRYVNGDGPPTLTAINHFLAQMASFRGVVTSGNPYDVTAGGVDATSDTSGSIPGDTTTLDGCLVAAFCSTGVDLQSSTEFSGWTNSDLLTAEEIMDRVGDVGNGGGFGAAIGEKVAAGAYGATSVTLVNASAKGLISVALKPDPDLVSPDCERLLFGQIIRHH